MGYVLLTCAPLFPGSVDTVAGGSVGIDEEENL